MKAIIKQWAIAAVAVMGLSVNEFGCGASPEDQDEPAPIVREVLGQVEEALSVPPSYGYVQQTGLPCVVGTTCIIPISKTLKTNATVLTGACAGSLWANAFNASTPLFNADASGTGFHTATQTGNPSLTPRCVSTLGGPFFKLTETSVGQPFQIGQFGYRVLISANLDVAGNDIVAFCQNSHKTNQQCQDFIRDQFRTMLNQAAGNQKNELTLTSADKSRMTAFAP